MSVNSEASVYRHSLGHRVPVRKCILPSVVAIMFPRNIKPVNEIEAIEDDAHEKDASKGDHVSQLGPDSLLSTNYGRVARWSCRSFKPVATIGAESRAVLDCCSTLGTVVRSRHLYPPLAVGDG